MSFMDSPHVQRAYEEALFLRERLIKQMETIASGKDLDLDMSIEYMHTLYALVEKEHSLHTRLRLSNDTEALVAAAELDGALIAATSDEFINADHYYRTLKDDIKRNLSYLSDEDLDELPEE